MKIKFNNIQDLSDARYAAAAMAEWIGFTIGVLPIAKVQEIIGWCAGPKLILELNQEADLDTIKSWVTILPVDGFECNNAQKELLTQEFPEANQWDWILTDSQDLPEENHQYSHSSAELNKTNHIVNISEYVNNPSIPASFNWGNISVNCYPEEEVGMKNFDNLTDLFEKLEIF